MSDPRDKAKEAAGAAKDATKKVGEKAAQKLADAKTETGLAKLVKELLNKIKPGMGDKVFEKVGGLIIAVFSGKLATLKEDVEKTRKAKKDEENSNDKKEEDGNDEEAASEEPEKEETEIEKLAKIPNVNERTVKIAEQMVKEKTTGKHCWDWCDKVYKAAKVKRGAEGYFSSHTKYEGKDCGKHCANDAQLEAIQPGAHIFINNRNKHDIHGNHSVIFLNWINKDKRIARVASCPFTNKPSKIHNQVLSPTQEEGEPRQNRQTPVTAISNPA